MRTPKEMANAVVDCWINDSEGNYVQGDPDQAAAALLTAWRDECVEGSNSWKKGFEAGQLAARTAMRSEAPASEDGAWDEVDDSFDRMAATFRNVEGENYERKSFEHGGSYMRHLIRKFVISRAPRAESVDFRELYGQTAVKLSKEIDRAETAEAERDRLGKQLNDLAGVLKGRKGKIVKLQLDITAKDEAGRRITEACQINADEIRRLSEENKALSKKATRIARWRDLTKTHLYEALTANMMWQSVNGLLCEENEALRIAVMAIMPLSDRDDVRDEWSDEFATLDALLRAKGGES